MSRAIQLHYFLIALGVVILVRAMFVFYTASFFLILLDIFVAISLLTGSIPHVISIPIRYCYYIRKAETISLIAATCMVIAVLAERLWM